MDPVTVLGIAITATRLLVALIQFLQAHPKLAKGLGGVLEGLQQAHAELNDALDAQKRADGVEGA